MMMKNKLDSFRNMSDTDLANYYSDLCAYDDNKAIEERRKCVIVICERFVDKFADEIPLIDEY